MTLPVELAERIIILAQVLGVNKYTDRMVWITKRDNIADFIYSKYGNPLLHCTKNLTPRLFDALIPRINENGQRLHKEWELFFRLLIRSKSVALLHHILISHAKAEIKYIGDYHLSLYFFQPLLLEGCNSMIRYFCELYPKSVISAAIKIKRRDDLIQRHVYQLSRSEVQGLIEVAMNFQNLNALKTLLTRIPRNSLSHHNDLVGRIYANNANLVLEMLPYYKSDEDYAVPLRVALVLGLDVVARAICYKSPTSYYTLVNDAPTEFREKLHSRLEQAFLGIENMPRFNLKQRVMFKIKRVFSIK
ncbi:hypothetical protein EDD86DRAFT_245592 [Gorgonomyces haynaldii]|nr:hypothetical protein EDD86DRAFT_245592 [Gorgonomyces haynaldii]